MGEWVNVALRRGCLRFRTWAAREALLWTAPAFNRKGIIMAHDEEPLLASPPTQEVARHVHDYEKFTGMIKWGAIICLIVGFAVLLMIS